jgi:hypothetical protein
VHACPAIDFWRILLRDQVDSHSAMLALPLLWAITFSL